MNYAPEIAGCGKFTGELGGGLTRLGHEVEVVTTSPHYPGWHIRKPYRNCYSVEKLEHVKVWRCPVLLPAHAGGFSRLIPPITFALTSAPVIVWRALFFRPDVVLVIEPTLFVAPISILCAAIVGAKSAIHVQDLEVDAAFAVGHLKASKLLVKLGRFFEQLCLKRFDKVVTISRRMAEALVSKGVTRQRVSMVRNWVDLDQIKPKSSCSSLRKELGIPQNAFVVLYSGNIGPKQGLQVVIEAAKLLSPSRAYFVIAGEGPAKASLQDLADGCANIQFLPFQPSERFAEFLGMCDVHVLPQMSNVGDLVLPSKIGGMLASGRPIIVTAEPNTELADFLRDVATVVRPEDPQALSRAIRDHLIRPTDRGSTLRALDLANSLARPLALRKIEAALLRDDFCSADFEGALVDALEA